MEPSVYTKLYWLIQDKIIGPEVFFNFLEFFWPNFTEIKQYVFLKEKYSEEEMIRLIKQNTNPEYWINLVTINDYFSDDENAILQSNALAKTLIEILNTKLQKDFPDKKFIVKSLQDEETGDVGLTFYQDNI